MSIQKDHQVKTADANKCINNYTYVVL